MASQLDIKRLKLELASISQGKAQTEYRIEEYLQQIEALKPTLEAQEAKEAELTKKLADLQIESK